MQKVISVIPAKPIEVIRGLTEARKKVCAYCRVSTDSEEQLSSYEAQVTYYEEHIKNRSEWEYAGVYADAGISGTNTKNRVEFNRMIEDALNGRIDMILTKSISRFGRNTLDVLKYVRMLKEKGIAIIFEKENIDSMDTKGEVLLTILSSLAQEESNNLSQISRWGIVRRFQQGKTRVNHKRFMGFDKDENGELIIDEEEAVVVRRIFDEYLQGKSCNKIAEGLEIDGILTVTGKEKWHESVIKKMLQNEKFCGDALLQKTVTIDFLNHKRIKNEGHVQQFYVENSHPAIVDKEIFLKVQKEMKRRSDLRGFTPETRSRHSNKYPFSGKIICGECGAVFRRKRWGATEKYRKFVWSCKNKEGTGGSGCSMKAVDDERLKNAFVSVINKMLGDKDDFIEKMMKNIQKVLGKNQPDFTETDSRLAELRQELTNLIRLNNRIDNEIYNDEYNRLTHEMEKLRESKSEYYNVERQCRQDMDRVKQIEKMLDGIEGLSNFDEELFEAFVEKIKVLSFVKVEFEMVSGVKVKAIL